MKLRELLLSAVYIISSVNCLPVFDKTTRVTREVLGGVESADKENPTVPGRGSANEPDEGVSEPFVGIMNEVRNDRAIRPLSRQEEATDLNNSVVSGIREVASALRMGIINIRKGLFDVIGVFDNSLLKLEEGIRSTSFNATLRFQKVVADLYPRIPPSVNNLLRSLGNSEGASGLVTQLNQVLALGNQLRRDIYDAWEEHEIDFHRYFQPRYPEFNQYLGVPPLPKVPLGTF